MKNILQWHEEYSVLFRKFTDHTFQYDGLALGGYFQKPGLIGAIAFIRKRSSSLKYLITLSLPGKDFR
jgi:hypothetical protein